MSSDPSITRRANTVVAFVQRADGGVLLVRDGEWWTLPAVATEGHWHAETAPISRALELRYGVPTAALRCLAHELDRVANHGRMLFALECLDDGALLPADARWAPPKEALVTTRADYSAIAEWLDRQAFDRAHPLRAPWTRRGWLDEATAWCAERLSEQGRRVTGRAEQVKHWCIASIVRVPADGGDAWLKAVPPLFAHEGALLELIGPSLPDQLPQVIASDRARGRALMEAAPHATLRGAPPRLHEEALRLLARLQQAWAGRVRELEAAGCADRRPATLAKGLAEILDREEVRERLDSADIERLRIFGETIPQRVEALRACGVPETLLHGDFHRGNVAVDGERLVIFDWTDGCISHPFFDLATFLPEEPVERAALAQAYIEAWAPVVGVLEAERAWEIAEPLALVHHAVSYLRIMDAIDPAEHWQFDSDPLFWLRWLRDVS
jgi:hypothetical protein